MYRKCFVIIFLSSFYPLKVQGGDTDSVGHQTGSETSSLGHASSGSATSLARSDGGKEGEGALIGKRSIK